MAPDATHELADRLATAAWLSAGPLLALCGALAGTLTALAWWSTEPWVMALAMAAGLAGAVLCARLVWPSAMLSAVPLLVGTAPSLAPDWAWAGGAIAAAAALAALVQRRQWRRLTLANLQQTDRIAHLEQARDAAMRTDQDKSRFLANASHDLRQPVHALGLFAVSLQRRLAHSADEPLARNLVRAVDGLERSFNAMLDISKLDAGALSPKLETFAVRDMFRRLHMQYAGQAEFAGLGLRFTPAGKTVSSDPQLLERIVGNLIQNAIKYTAHGGVAVVARNHAGGVNVEVWDTGPGIAEAELPRIFGEFYQVGRGERDRAHGLGMGLAIVKRLAALLGHRLEVASVVGKGTVFRIGVPAGGLPGIDETLSAHDTQPMVWLTTQTILVVDDEEAIREGLLMLLQEWGFQAMTAANAQQAEQAVTALEGRVDLVLSDLHLGGGPDGVEVIANVRRLCGRDIPAILVTGDTAHGQDPQVLGGNDPVLFKPVQPRRLFDALREALGE